MKRLLVIAAGLVVASAIFYVTVYRRRGPGQELGRKLDEGIEKILHGDETTIQKTGRRVKETADDLTEEMKKK